MTSEQRLVFARAVSPDPFAPGVVAGMGRGLAGDPTYDVLRSGGSLLELGCGVAGRVLAMLQALPGMRAVGVELSDDLAAEATRRAEALGLTDRFEVVVTDAATFDRPDAFDRGYWSQFFFAEDSRRTRPRDDDAEPSSAEASSRPPCSATPRELAAEPHGQAARERAVFRVVLGSWGVPDRSAGPARGRARGPRLRRRRGRAGTVRELAGPRTPALTRACPEPIRARRAHAVRWRHRRSSRHQRRASGRTVRASGPQ